MGSTIWLLREEKKNDPYKKVFADNGYDPVFIEVLRFEFANAEELASKLKSGSEYSGLVITSQTAASSISSTIANGFLSREELISAWSSHPVYVVGGATATSVRDLGLSNCVGEESGKADVLADFIIQHHATAGNSPSNRPLLFPCGNLRKDTLPDKLKLKGFTLNEVTCYNTCAANDIQIKTAEVIKSKGPPHWIVLFSPSGVQYCYKEIPHIMQKTKICSFGPTTAEALRSCGLHSHVTFSAPYKPDRLVALLSDYDGEKLS